MSTSFRDILKIEEKKALYGILFLTCLTPGILYVYLKDPSFLSSLTNTKIILIGVSGAAPGLALNIIVAFAAAYFFFTRKKYRNRKTRLQEKVINRVALTSGIMATSLVFNLCIVALYLMDFEAPGWYWFLAVAVAVDVAFVVAFVLLIRLKVDQDLFHHNFGG